MKSKITNRFLLLFPLMAFVLQVSSPALSNEFSGQIAKNTSLSNGRKIAIYTKGKRAVLPNGDVFEADGVIVKKNGVRIKPIWKDGRVVGAKFYRPDGTEISKGRGKLSSGESYRLR